MNKRQLDRNAAKRLAIIRHAREVTGNVALTCRYYGTSRQVFCTWLRRYQKEGLAGLRGRSRRPLHCPHETSSEVAGKIVYLRTSYHFGPAKIAMYLKRHHDIETSTSGIWRILKRLDLNRLPASQRYQHRDRKRKRYVKPLPGHQVQTGVKFIASLSTASRKEHYQFTAIGDCTRLRVLRIYDRLNQKTAIQFAGFLLDKLPFRAGTTQTGNGSGFQSAFRWHLPGRGIRHVYIKSATPRLNGKAERSHRIDGEEFYRMLKGAVIDGTPLLSDKLAEWEAFCNYHRPHGAIPSVTCKVWPTAWECQLVRAPGAKRTKLTITRDGSSPR